MLQKRLLLQFFLTYFRKVRDDYKLFEKLKIPGPKPMMVFGSIGEFKDKVTVTFFPAQFVLSSSKLIYNTILVPLHFLAPN